MDSLELSRALSVGSCLHLPPECPQFRLEVTLIRRGHVEVGSLQGWKICDTHGMSIVTKYCIYMFIVR